MDPSDVPDPRLRPMAEGRYVDFTPVGQGGMGIVYWALDTELSRQIAFKVIRPPGAGTEEGITPSAPLGLESPGERAAFDGLRRRFLQEAWITGGMEHPGIVPVYELGETDGGVPYYTMRFVRGSRTLRSAIEELAEAGVERRLDVLLEPFVKVCDTIRYAHSCGVIHRDLKPENVALGEYGEVVVLDWGLAKVKGGLDGAEDPWTDRITDMREVGNFKTVASVLGTPGFMAPEAARGEIESLDEASDVYALGVMLFQILTGRLPFAFRNAEEYTTQVLSQDPPDPRAREPGVPRRLASLCLHALAREPAARPASADAFTDAIRTWRSEVARDREVQVLLEQASVALAPAAAQSGDELLRSLDGATAACRRVLQLDPEHVEARAHLERAHALRERGIQERERAARRRTVRRIGGIVLAAGLLAALVVAGLLEARRREAADARRQAEDDRARAEGVMDFMVFELRESLEPIGRLDVLAKLGARARDYYANLPREGLSTKSLIGHTVTLRRLGEIYEARGDLPAALEAYRLAGDVAGRILERTPTDALGRYHHSLAEARVGMALFLQGYASDAKRILLGHREDVERLLRDHPDEPEYLDALAASHAALGRILRTEGRWDEARRACDEALERSRELESRHPGDERWTRLRLRRQIHVVRLLRDSGKFERSIERAKATLDECLREMEAEERATDVRWQELEAACRYALARALDGMHSGELATREAAHGAYARLHALDPDNDTWRFKICQTLILMARLHLYRGAPRTGHAFTTEAFEIAQGLTEKDPTNATWQNLLITLCDHMARHMRVSNQGREEQLAYRGLAAKHARHLLTLDPSNARWRHILAYTLSQLGTVNRQFDDAEARRLLGRSIEIAADLLVDNPVEYELAMLQAMTRRELGSLDLLEGSRGLGLRQWRAALEDLDPCWGAGVRQFDLASAIVKLHDLLVRVLSEGDADERAEARRHTRGVLDFVRRAVEEASGWSPAQLEGFRARRDALERALGTSASGADAPK